MQREGDSSMKKAKTRKQVVDEVAKMLEYDETITALDKEMMTKKGTGKRSVKKVTKEKSNEGVWGGPNVIAGWRIYFYANENFEPIHVHAEKSEMEIKFWIDVDDFKISEATSFNCAAQAKREIKKIYWHFSLQKNTNNKMSIK